MKASKLLKQACIRYLCYATETKEEVPKIEDIPTGCEFPDVFREELPGLPPQSEIDFEIELNHDTRTISKVHIEYA